MRWPRRRHRRRIVTGYEIACGPYGFYERVIYRGCACGLNLTPTKEPR